MILFGSKGNASSSGKKDSDLQPLKSGTLADLDEDAEKEKDYQASKPSSDSTNQVEFWVVLR